MKLSKNLMNTQKSDPPSFSDLISSLVEGGQDLKAGFQNLFSPVKAIKKAIPANAAAMINFALGDGQTPMTEEYLNSEDIGVLQRAIAKAEEEGRDYITYGDYGDDEAYQKGRSAGPGGREGFQEESRRGIKSIVGMMNEPSSRMLTTLGSAKFNKNEDGSYTITDNFDFNRGSEEARFVLKDMMQQTGLSADEVMKRYLDNRIMGPINLIRDGYFGSQLMNDGTFSDDPDDRPLLYNFIRETVAPIIQYQAAGGSSTTPAVFEGYGSGQNLEWAHPEQHTVRKGKFNVHSSQPGLPIEFNIPPAQLGAGGNLNKKLGMRPIKSYSN